MSPEHPPLASPDSETAQTHRRPVSSGRRAGDRGSMAKDWKLTVIMTLISTIGGGSAGYYSGLAAIGERVRATEVRQEEQFKALSDRISQVTQTTREGQNDIRSDLNGIRGELMAILKELR